jgi:hypothetical protein
MNLKVKIAVTALSLAVIAASICHESPRRQASRLEIEAAKIQTNTLRAVMENDLKFSIDLDEEAQFFVRLRADLQRCRAIEARLREISPDAELSQLEGITTGILELITQREKQNNDRLEFTRKQEEANRVDWDKVPAWEPGQAGPPGRVKPAARSEPTAEGDDKLQPEMEERPR